MAFTRAARKTMLLVVEGLVIMLHTVTFVWAEKCPNGMLYDNLKAKCVCQVDMYYDLITRRCTDCYSICNNAAHQRTSDECNSLCPAYHLPLNDMPMSDEEEDVKGAIGGERCAGDMDFDDTKMKCVCPKDMFYDQVIRHCSSCYDICYHADMQRTQDACNYSCPDYHLPSTTTIAAFLISTPHTDPDYHKDIVIALSIIAIIGAFIAVIVSCRYCKCKSKALLPCFERGGNGTEAEADKFHENIQLALKERPSEVFDIQQPKDGGENGLLAPSGHATNEAYEETSLKVGHQN